jgi:hypothetical protein
MARSVWLSSTSSAPAVRRTFDSIASYEWSPDGQRIVLTHYLQMRYVVLLTKVAAA